MHLMREMGSVIRKHGLGKMNEAGLHLTSLTLGRHVHEGDSTCLVCPSFLSVTTLASTPFASTV